MAPRGLQRLPTRRRPSNGDGTDAPATAGRAGPGPDDTRSIELDTPPAGYQRDAEPRRRSPRALLGKATPGGDPARRTEGGPGPRLKPGGSGPSGLAVLAGRIGAKGPKALVPLLVLALLVLAGGVFLLTRPGGGTAPPAVTTTLAPEQEATTVPPVSSSSTAPVVTASTAPGRPRTVTTLPTEIPGGTARIAGTVTGPSGPVPNATLRIERFVGDVVTGVTLTSAQNGGFSLPSIRGGNYRVRVWRAPDLVLSEPAAFFLAADEQKTLDVRLATVSDLNVRAAFSPDPPPKEDLFLINVTVYAGTVTNEGTIVGTTRNGLPMQITLRQNLGLQGLDRAVTDGNGVAVFRVRCIGAGPTGADVTIGTTKVPLTLPNCPA